MISLTKQINTISRASATYRLDHLECCGLRPCHYGYVFVICRRPGITQEELSKELCLHKSSITRSLAFLEDHGYITRRKSETDKRELLVFPTSKMEELLPRLRAVSQQWNAYLTDGIPQNELDSFYATMAKISERARRYTNGGKGTAE